MAEMRTEKKVSSYDAIVYGLRGALEHIQLFFLAEIVATIFLCGLCLLLIVLVQSLFGNVAAYHQMLEQKSFATFAKLFKILINLVDPIHLIWAILGCIIFYWSCLMIELGYIKMSLQVHDQGSSTISILFKTAKMVPHFFLMNIMYFISVGLGLILGIVPGIFLMFRFALASYFIVDKNVGAIEALRMSYHAMAGNMWQMVGLWIVWFAFFGINSFIIVLLWPPYYMATAYFYRHVTADLHTQS